MSDLADFLSKSDSSGARWVSGAVRPENVERFIRGRAGQAWAAEVLLNGRSFHAVVVDGFVDGSDNLLRVLDPLDGSIREVALNEFLEKWTGYVVGVE